LALGATLRGSRRGWDYGWFSEGFGTTDLTDAKALLDELRKENAVLEVRDRRNRRQEVLRRVRKPTG
jgi:hypothetical protein